MPGGWCSTSDVYFFFFFFLLTMYFDNLITKIAEMGQLLLSSAHCKVKFITISRPGVLILQLSRFMANWPWYNVKLSTTSEISITTSTCAEIRPQINSKCHKYYVIMTQANCNGSHESKSICLNFKYDEKSYTDIVSFGWSIWWS